MLWTIKAMPDTVWADEDPDEKNAELVSLLRRYIDDYDWNWSMTRDIINRKLNAQYTADELKRIYEYEVK